MKSTFEKKETQSKRKQQIEQAEVDFLKIKAGNSYVVGLVGNRKGLLAHVNRYKNMGFKEENIIICEIDRETHRGLTAEKSKLKLKCPILHQDICEISNNPSIDLKLIDFDDHQLFGNSHMNAIKAAAKKGASIIITNSSRGQKISHKHTKKAALRAYKKPASIKVMPYAGVTGGPMRSMVIRPMDLL